MEPSLYLLEQTDNMMMNRLSKIIRLRRDKLYLLEQTDNMMMNRLSKMIRLRRDKDSETEDMQEWSMWI